MSAVENAIKGMRDGTLNPDEIKIDGIETDEEKKKREVLIDQLLLLFALLIRRFNTAREAFSRSKAA